MFLAGALAISRFQYLGGIESRFRQPMAVSAPTFKSLANSSIAGHSLMIFLKEFIDG